MPFNILDNSAIFSNKKISMRIALLAVAPFCLQEYSGKIGPPRVARSHEPCNYMSIFLGHFS